MDEPLKPIKPDEIVEIENVCGIEVNAYLGGFSQSVPVVEVLVRSGRVALNLEQTDTLRRLLSRAQGYWESQGHVHKG